MIRCRSCLIPDTRPDTEFVNCDCSACRNFVRRVEIDWAARRLQLEQILESGRNGSGFDCIVPSSGGKDSHHQVMELIKLGARPLVVTASTCYLTPIGRVNIDNLKRYATTVEFSPNLEVRAKMNRAGLKLVGDISYPEHLAIFTTPFKASADFGIPLVFYGESPQREYGCPPGAEEAMQMTRRWVHEFGGLLGLRIDDLIGYDGIKRTDLQEYRWPSEEALQRAGTRAYFLGQFEPWDSHKNAEQALSMGMRQELPCYANAWVHENLDNGMTGIHDHMMYRKYGYGRLAAQLSVDIRNGRIERRHALTRVQAYDGTFPFEYCHVSVHTILDHIGIGWSEFVEIMDQFTNWELFDRVVDHRPILKNAAALVA